MFELHGIECVDCFVDYYILNLLSRFISSAARHKITYVFWREGDVTHLPNKLNSYSGTTCDEYASIEDD